MTLEEILEKVTIIFKDVFDRDNITLTRETTAKDVEDWDSLNNIQIIIAIEKAFKIKFKTAEIRAWKNIGEMCESIARASG